MREALKLLAYLTNLMPRCIKFLLLAATINLMNLDNRSNAQEIYGNNCNPLFKIIQQRTGVNLWNKFPNLSFSIEDQSFAVSVHTILRDAPQHLWRYLNDICAGCAIDHSNNPDIILSRFNRPEDIKGGALIYSPPSDESRKAPDEYLLDQLQNGQQVFTSLNVIDRGSIPPVQVTLISVYSGRPLESLSQTALITNLFEAYADVKFWSDNKLREEFTNEINSGCLDNKSNKSCYILEFGRFLYRNKDNTFLRDRNFTSALKKLCGLYKQQGR